MALVTFHKLNTKTFCKTLANEVKAIVPGFAKLDTHSVPAMGKVWYILDGNGITLATVSKEYERGIGYMSLLVKNDPYQTEKGIS